MPPRSITTNTLFYGDNLEILREYIADASVGLVSLTPPFSSNRNYNRHIGPETVKPLLIQLPLRVRCAIQRWLSGRPNRAQTRDESSMSARTIRGVERCGRSLRARQ